MVIIFIVRLILVEPRVIRGFIQAFYYSGKDVIWLSGLGNVGDKKLLFVCRLYLFYIYNCVYGFIIGNNFELRLYLYLCFRSGCY